MLRIAIIIGLTISTAAGVGYRTAEPLDKVRQNDCSDSALDKECEARGGKRCRKSTIRRRWTASCRCEDVSGALNGDTAMEVCVK